MEIFNKLLDTLKNKEDGDIDTDTTTGTFGSIESDGASEETSADKLVLYLDSGVEIHIPTAIHEQMTAVMAGEAQTEVPEVTASMGGECPHDGSGNGEGKGLGKGLGKGQGDGPLSPDEEVDKSDCEDNNAKDCPFEKDENDDEDNENKKDEE